MLDWDKYPYKYVHVDLTFDFLNTVNSYLSTSGDVDFVNKNWDALQAAHRYCRSLLDPKDGLPRIPPDKEGSNEQDPLNDDLTLSTSWVAAAEAFADLATATGHTAQAASRPAAPANRPEGQWVIGTGTDGKTFRSVPTAAQERP